MGRSPASAEASTSSAGSWISRRIFDDERSAIGKGHRFRASAESPCAVLVDFLLNLWRNRELHRKEDSLLAAHRMGDLLRPPDRSRVSAASLPSERQPHHALAGFALHRDFD